MWKCFCLFQLPPTSPSSSSDCLLSPIQAGEYQYHATSNGAVATPAIVPSARQSIVVAVQQLGRCCSRCMFRFACSWFRLGRTPRLQPQQPQLHSHGQHENIVTLDSPLVYRNGMYSSGHFHGDASAEEGELEGSDKSPPYLPSSAPPMMPPPHMDEDYAI
jgi:hypothetical protein